jgi:outer membrane lipoprotein carrier protein
MHEKIRGFMRSLLLFFLMLIPLFAFDTDLQSFHARFVQTITDENNKSIVYRGTLWAQRPDSALWHYREPVEKSIYVRSGEVVIIEPDLEQAIVRRLNEDIDFLQILSRARKSGPELYEAQYGSQIFRIAMRGEVVDSISYSDSFDNRVTINFSEQQQNAPIDPERFRVSIPPFYDIVR